MLAAADLILLHVFEFQLLIATSFVCFSVELNCLLPVHINNRLALAMW